MSGQLVVERAGVGLSDRMLGSRKARLLLALLAVERGHLVPNDRIVDVVWGEHPPADPDAGVAILVSRLRRVLGDGVVSGRRGAYGLLSGGAWTTDLDQADRLAEEASDRWRRREPALAVAAACRALELLGAGRLLDDQPDAEWPEPARLHADRVRRHARHVGSQAARAIGDDPTAHRLAEQAVDADPLDEQARRDLMRSLAAEGNTAAALDAFADLVVLLRDELGTDPDTETAALHLALLRGQPLGEDGQATSVRPRPPPAIVGRNEDLARIADAWSNAVSSHPQLVVVAGEAGIGKTRLLTEIVRIIEETGGTALTVRCHPAERSLFLQPMVDLLRPVLLRMAPGELSELVGNHADAVVAMIPDLQEALGVGGLRSGPPEVERRRAYDAVALIVHSLARRNPLLLAFDDLHEAGAATIDLLAFLRRHLEPSRVLIVAAVRAEDDVAAARLADVAVRVDLGPLPPSAVAAMVAAAGSAEHANLIVSRTRGHPLSVVETLRAMASGEPGIPSSLAQAIRARVRRTGDELSRVVGAASVLGAGVEPALLAGLLEDTELGAVRRCEQLVRARLLVPTGDHYEFTNDLVQEVVHESLPTPVRAAYHRHAANLLADRPELMARHAEAAGDLARAARGWLLAGEQAMHRSAAEDAVALFDRACAAIDERTRPDDLVRACLARARAYEALTDWAAALDDIQTALRKAREVGDRRQEMMALRALGGDPAVALHHPVDEWVSNLRTGLSLAETLGDRRAEADFNGRLSVLETTRLQLASALTLAREGVRRARAARDDDAVVSRWTD